MLLSVLGITAVIVFWRAVEPMLAGHPAVEFLASTPVNVTFMLFAAMQPLLTTVGFLPLYNETMQDELRLAARRDPLTGVGNQLGLVQAIGELLEVAARDRTPLGAMMLDADQFKSVNDRFGHQGGDEALRTLATTIGARWVVAKYSAGSVARSLSCCHRVVTCRR